MASDLGSSRFLVQAGEPSQSQRVRAADGVRQILIDQPVFGTRNFSLIDGSGEGEGRVETNCPHAQNSEGSVLWLLIA